MFIIAVLLIYRLFPPPEETDPETGHWNLCYWHDPGYDGPPLLTLQLKREQTGAGEIMTFPAHHISSMGRGF